MKVLPKGHISCLSKSFRYTPAMNTNVANTFARITRELKLPAAGVGAPGAAERSALARPFSLETIEAAQRLLRAGGLRLAPHLVHSS
jgi:hypothetical protein